MRQVNKEIFKPDRIGAIGSQDADKLLIGDRLRGINQKIVDELADSFIANGVLQPIVVTVTGDQNLKVIAGVHRVMAIKKVWRDRPELDLALPIHKIMIAEDDEKIIEIAENLHRNELSAGERASMTAMILAMMKGENVKQNKMSSKTGKTEKTEKTKCQVLTFSTPKQADVIAMLGTTRQTFNLSFTAYKDAESVTSGWTKLTEAEYDGFIQWSKDKADSEVEKVKKAEEAGAEASINKEEARQARAEARINKAEAKQAEAEAKINKEWQKFFTGFKKKFEELNTKTGGAAKTELQDYLNKTGDIK